MGQDQPSVEARDLGAPHKWIDVNAAIMSACIALTDRCGYQTLYQDDQWTCGAADIVRALLEHPQVAFALRDIALDVECQMPSFLRSALAILDTDEQVRESERRSERSSAA